MISEGMLQLGVSLWERIMHSAYQKALEIRIYLLTVLLQLFVALSSKTS